MKTSFAIAAAVLMLAATPAAAVTVLAAAPSAACEGEGGCMMGANTYVRTISAADFAGGQNIASLVFDRSILEGREGAMFRITFWVGGEEMVGNFGSFVISGLAGDDLVLSGDDFWYDPAWGDLMIRVDIASDASGAGLPPLPGLGAPGGDEGDGSFASAFLLDDEFDPGSQNQEGEGGNGPPPLPNLVSPAPEPSAWALMIMGFGAAGALIRRRRPHLI